MSISFFLPESRLSCSSTSFLDWKCISTQSIFRTGKKYKNTHFQETQKSYETLRIHGDGTI